MTTPTSGFRTTCPGRPRALRPSRPSGLARLGHRPRHEPDLHGGGREVGGSAATSGRHLEGAGPAGPERPCRSPRRRLPRDVRRRDGGRLVRSRRPFGRTRAWTPWCCSREDRPEGAGSGRQGCSPRRGRGGGPGCPNTPAAASGEAGDEGAQVLSGRDYTALQRFPLLVTSKAALDPERAKGVDALRAALTGPGMARALDASLRMARQDTAGACGRPRARPHRRAPAGPGRSPR